MLVVGTMTLLVISSVLSFRTILISYLLSKIQSLTYCFLHLNRYSIIILVYLMAGLVSLSKIFFTLLIFVHLIRPKFSHCTISILSSHYTLPYFLPNISGILFYISFLLASLNTLLAFSFQLFFHLLSRNISSIKVLVVALLCNHSQHKRAMVYSSWIISTTMHL